MFLVTVPYNIESVKYFSMWIFRMWLSRISLWIHFFFSWRFLSHFPSSPSRFLAFQMSIGMQVMGEKVKSSSCTFLVVADLKLEF